MRLARRLGGLLAALFVWTAQAQSLERSAVHIAVGGQASFYYLPITIAEQRGYFKDAGLTVKISDFTGGSEALRAVVGGSADVVSGAYEHIIDMQAKNQLFEAFVLQGRLPQTALGIASARAASYRSARDLKGLRIGVSAPGSSTNMLLNYFLAKDGLSPRDVAIIGVGTAATAVAAMKSGRIDALSNVEPMMTRLEQDGSIRIIADTRTIQGTQALYGGLMPAGCLYAPAAFVQKYPATVQALADAIVRADRWIQHASAEDLVRTVPERFLLGDKALYAAAFLHVREAFSPDGIIDEAAARTALRVLSSFNPEINPAKIRLDLTYTNQFAAKSDAKYP
jgi:NitT/TauT family transport system substrate-binding protein